MENKLSYVHMTSMHLLNKHKKLLQAFKNYQKRYLNVGKKPNIVKLLPSDLYHTMRLEGENISKKQAQALFGN
jgi:hypothetical protein